MVTLIQTDYKKRIIINTLKIIVLNSKCGVLHLHNTRKATFLKY